MGFSSFHNSTQNPAEVYYRWSGGMKEIQLPDGSSAKQPKGELQYWDGEANQVVALPFQFCVLEQTRSITGFSPVQGQNIRYYSNECIEYNDEIVVMRKDDSGTEEVIRGVYSDIKKNLPQGARLQINLYIYNPMADRIERINLTGSALSAFIDFSKKNKGIYEHSILMKAGEVKTTGTVDYVAPEFTLGPAYYNEEMAKLTAEDKKVVDYMQERRNANKQGDTSLDQTPSQYQGEESQEIVVDQPEVQPSAAGQVVTANDGGEEIDFNSLPF